MLKKIKQFFSKKNKNRQLSSLDKELNVTDKTCSIILVRKNGVIRYANKRFCVINNCVLGDVLGTNINRINSGHRSTRYWTKIYQTMENNGNWKDKIKLKTLKENEFYWANIEIKPFRDETTGTYVIYLTETSKI